MKSSSLVALVRGRAEERPQGLSYAFLAPHGSGVEVAEQVTFATLENRARALAARLQSLGAQGERALLLFPPGIDYIVAFLGCLTAGAVAVPAYPPRMNRHLGRLEAILDDARPRVALTSAAVMRQLLPLLAEAPALAALSWVVVEEVALEEAAAWRDPGVHADSLAFLQYTSASTARPKGVMVSHGNLIHNEQLMTRVLGHGPDTVIVSWLPLFHDMGLIGNVLAALYHGVPCYLMAPVDFLKRPRRWLEAISRFGGTFSGGPDYGYQLCVDKVGPADREGLDLSSWRAAFNGSEPVRAATLRRFSEAFASCGFQPAAMFPCYGLAEFTLFVSGRFQTSPPPRFDRAGLEAHQAREMAARGPEGQSTELVSCGATALDCHVVIADPDTGRALGEGEVGEVWLAGPSVAQGYWNRPEETAAAFAAQLQEGPPGVPTGPYLRTGDLGFLHRGELFITGRLKDLIILRGRNLIPQDLELVVEGVDEAIRPAFVAAVSVDAAGAERLVVVAEVRREARHDLDTAGLLERIRSAVAAEAAAEPSAVVLLRPNSLPKTSSGKTQRAEVRRAFLAGELVTLAEWRDPDVFGARPGAAWTVERLEAWLYEHLAARLRRPLAQLPRGVALGSYGLDSVVAVAFVGEIEELLGVTLDVDQLFTGEPTVRQLAEQLLGAPAAPPAQAPERAPERAPEPAVVHASRNGHAGPSAPVPGRREHPFATCVNPELGRLLAQMAMDKSFVRGAGSWLWDHEGRRTLDFLAQYGAVPFGFNPARIWAALHQVEASGEPSFVQPSYLDAAGELARRLLAAAPRGLAHVTFANSGAEAVEAAIKLCRSTTGRPKMLAASNGFHGKTLGALSATDKEKYQRGFGAPVPGYDYVPFGDLEALRSALSTGEYAGFLVEPIQGEGGIVEPPASYLRLAFKACREAGTLFVADEIQTGLGRTGVMFVCTQEGFTPDVLTVAKALGGGLLPIGACLATAAAYNQDFALKHTSTFAGNTLACRVGLAVLDWLEEDGGALIDQVAENGARLRAGLLALQRRFPELLGEVRGRGYLLGLRFGLDRYSGGEGLLGYLGEQDVLTAMVVSHLLHFEGVRVGYTLNQGGVMRIEPPLTATWEECEYFLRALERVLERLERRDLALLSAHVTGYDVAQAPPASPPRVRRQRLDRRQEDGHFAFLVHPLALTDYADLDGSLGALAPPQLETLSAAIADNFDPFVIGETRVVAADGRAAHGEFILVPRRAEELRAMHPSDALSEVRDAVRLAKKRGARIVGLGAYTSVVTQGGLRLHGNGRPPITTGNSFTVAAARRAVQLAAAARGWDLAERTVAVVGAGGAIGQALAALLARDAGRLILLGNPAHPEESRQRLSEVVGRMVQMVVALDPLRNGAGLPASTVAGQLEHLGFAVPATGDRNAWRALGEGVIQAGVAVEISVDAPRWVPEADVVVCCTSSTEHLVTADGLRHGAVVCDVSRPPNVCAGVVEVRPDVMLIDGGVVRMPGRSSLGFNASLGEGNAYACMAETMMLAIEQRYQDTSLGFDLPLAQVLELNHLADRLGFEVVLETRTPKRLPSPPSAIEIGIDCEGVRG